MQKILMYPDFGNECFWYSPSGAVSDIEEFAPMLLPDSQLYHDIKKWCKEFQSCEMEDFDWNAFDKIGKTLYSKLKKLLHGKYTLEYLQSCEEIQARQKSRK